MNNNFGTIPNCKTTKEYLIFIYSELRHFRETQSEIKNEIKSLKEQLDGLKTKVWAISASVSLIVSVLLLILRYFILK